MHFVYIIQSLKDNSFYIGRTSDLKKRLEYHNDVVKNVGKTRNKIPWVYFFTLRVENISLATNIERHIKSMKSRVYIENLVKYPEIAQRLIKRYS